MIAGLFVKNIEITLKLTEEWKDEDLDEGNEDKLDPREIKFEGVGWSERNFIKAQSRGEWSWLDTYSDTRDERY